MTWTSSTANAPWAARSSHTSVVDAISGAIYVIGGRNGGDTYYKDVWVSTDGGADPTQPVLGGYLGGTRGYHGVLLGCSRGTGSTRGVKQGYPRGVLPEGY